MKRGIITFVTFIILNLALVVKNSSRPTLRTSPTTWGSIKSVEYVVFAWNLLKEMVRLSLIKKLSIVLVFRDSKRKSGLKWRAWKNKGRKLDQSYLGPQWGFLKRAEGHRVSNLIRMTKVELTGTKMERIWAIVIKTGISKI